MTLNFNPLDLLAMKQKVGQEDADKTALPVLIHFDAAKRGRCTVAGAYLLTFHLICASYMARRLRRPVFHRQVTAAYAALGKASARPTELLALTTTEYHAIRPVLAKYLDDMPSFEVGMMAEAAQAASKELNL